LLEGHQTVIRPPAVSAPGAGRDLREDIVRPNITQSRMLVVFGASGMPKCAYGPYCAVQITPAEVWVFSEDCPLQLAVRREKGWHIVDPLDEGPPFQEVWVICPPGGGTAEEIAQWSRPR
jgi:hypothetical protein